MKEITINNKKIYIFEKLLPEEICLDWINRIHNLNPIIGSNKDFADEIFYTIQKLAKNFPIDTKGNLPEITYGMKSTPISAHYDKKLRNERWKLFCYLNDVKNGGTEFYDGKNWVNIDANVGTVVLFDMDLFHRGQQNQENKIKYIAGVRLQ